MESTQNIYFRSTQPKLYFPKIMEISHYNEYGVTYILYHSSVLLIFVFFISITKHCITFHCFKLRHMLHLSGSKTLRIKKIKNSQFFLHLVFGGKAHASPLSNKILSFSICVSRMRHILHPS